MMPFTTYAYVYTTFTLEDMGSCGTSAEGCQATTEAIYQVQNTCSTGRCLSKSSEQAPGCRLGMLPS